MKLLPAGIFIWILLWVRVSAGLFPQGYQWNYTYYALLRSGSLLPSEANSQWDLRALLTISAIGNNTIAQLSQFNTSIYNGLKDEIPQDLQPAPIPPEANVLGTPFLINYAGAQVESISVNEDDPLWAVNIKRAIASILQLNLNKLDSSASFISESNIYGNCEEIEYSVVNNTEYVYVRKVIDHLKCSKFPVQEWSSTAKFECSGAEEDPFSSSTTREYTLARRENSYELKHVLSNKRLYVQPFQAQGEAQQVYQYQIYQLLSTSPLTKNVEMPLKPIRKSLLYEHHSMDISHGRQQMTNSDKLLSYINTVLNQMILNLDEPNISKNITNLHRQDSMNLYYSLLLSNKENLVKLYSDIAIGTSYQQETKRNIFLELLPQIGTEDSVNFMKELITKRELKDLVSIKMLSVYPFYVRQYSTKLLNDMDALLNLGDNYDSKIRHTAILSFATLVYKTYDAGQCSLEIVENYALKYFNWFSDSTSYEKRMLYLQALSNLQLGSVANYLSSIILNSDQSRHIRFLAIWGSMATATLRPKQVYEVHWPILTDRTQHLEMRAASLLVLLIAQPTRSRLLILFWYMQAETDPHLYNMFYTTLVSLQNTQYPCYKQLGTLASQVVRLLRTPRNQQHWMTGNYIFDYTNTEKAFGAITQLHLIGNPVTNSPNVIYIKMNHFGTNMNLNDVGIFLKLQGVTDHVREMLNTETIDADKIQRMIKLLEKSNVKLMNAEEIHIEFQIKVQGKTVFCYYIDNNKFKKSANELLSLKILLEYHVNYQSTFLPYVREHLEPSDIGTLIARGVISNTVSSTRGNFLTQKTKQLYTHEFAMNFRYSTYTVNFLELFNPISNIWHGVHKSKSLHGRFLFNGTLTLDLEKTIAELREARNGDEYFSILFHTLSRTYIVNNGTKGILQHHCPKCTDEYVIDGGPADVNSRINFPSESFGHKFQVEIFDCKNYQDVKKLLLNVYSSHQSNAQIMPIVKPVLYGMHLIDYITYTPSQSSCGILVTLEPLYQEPAELVITLHLQRYFTSSSLSDPEGGIDVASSLTLIQRKVQPGPILQFWNATFVFVSKPGKRNINMTLIIEHINAEDMKQKLCMNTQLYLPERQADMFSMKPSGPTIAMLQSVFGKHTGNQSSCPDDGASIEAVAIASVTDEQKSIASTTDKWPYDECHKSVRKHKFTPISLPCYLASKEIATYRKYISDIKFSNMPEWFISVAQKINSFIGLIQKYSTQDDAITKSVNITNVKSLIEFSALKPLVTVKLNNKEAVIDYSGFEFIENFFVNTRFLLQDDWNINLGLSKICLITPNFITTVDNRTIQVDETKIREKDILITADCSQYPKFAVFLDGSSNFEELAFTLHAGSDYLNVKPHNKNISVMLNGESFMGELDKSNINAWRLQDDVILARSKYGGLGIDVYYTKEYMVITIPGFYTGKICGICSSVKNNLP